MKTLYRKDKIKMFLLDYYSGYGKLISILRIAGGPLIILIGINLYNKEVDKFYVAYSGFCLLYGIYYSIKPFIWVLFRLPYYKTENIEIKIIEGSLLLTNEHNESKIGFETFKKILDNKSYFSFVVSRSQRLRIPKTHLDNEGLEIINKHIKNNKTKEPNRLQ